jgi:hypothetical protein
MSDEVTSTWATRELPILKLALRNLDTGQTDLTATEGIRAELGFDAATMNAGLKALEKASPPYIEAAWNVAGSQVRGYITGITERTRVELGSWPSPASVVDQLVEALTAAADRETEPDKKGRLRSTADALSGFARDVAVGVVAARMGSAI